MLYVLNRIVLCCALVAWFLPCTVHAEGDGEGPRLTGPAAGTPTTQHQYNPFVDDVANGYVRSSSSGPVRHCRLSGTLPMRNRAPEHVMLHLFTYLFLNGSSLYVKGFAWFESLEVFKAAGPQLAQAASAGQYTGGLYLRVPSTGKYNNVSLSLETRPFHVSSLWANISLPGAPNPEHELQRELDYELHADGFDYYCMLVAELPSRSHHQVPLYQVDMTRQRPADGSRAVNRTASTTHFVVSPMHSLAVADQVMLLEAHMRYHAALGVTRYVVYVLDSLAQMLRNARVQALVTSGQLQLVLFDDFSRHIYDPAHPRKVDLYTHQHIIYNHAILSYWMVDVFLVMADLDEYFMTPQRTTIAQVMRTCVPRPGITAVMQVVGQQATCVVCDQAKPDIYSWRNMSITQGQHPLLMYQAHKRLGQPGEGWNPLTKCVVDPTFVSTYTVHYGFVMHGATVHVQPDMSCIRFVHLAELYRRRHIEASKLDLDDSMWWPFQPSRPRFALVSAVAGG